jgi:radical SAM superfamily enzyme YgiQ (UPF0313 family)
MRILFIYSVQKSIFRDTPLLGQEGIYFGISLISSILKKHGHECELVILDRQYKNTNIRTLSEKITSFNPQFLAFTAVYSEFDFICSIATEIRKSYAGLFFYLGGVHVTLNPDEKYLDLFNAFCVGEGEEATLELVENLEHGKNIHTIPNLWIKTEKGIFKNPPRPFVADLDALPFPDREMWQQWIFNHDTKLTVLIGRGCPFNCTYCCNHKLRKVSSGKYLRFRTPENILAEIKELHQSFPKVDEIYLEVETLGVNLRWLDNFCKQLHQFGKETDFRLRFATNLRIFPSLNVDFVFENFKKANITSVTIGLESGNYRIRKEILNRDYSNEIILRATEIARKYGIDISLFNMIGLPTETLSDFSDTVKMNQIIQPAYHATSIFFPYPGTALHQMCENMQLLPEKINTKDERQIATLNLPGFSKKQIQKSFDSFHYNVYKVRNDKSKVKLFIYYSMKYLGHNFYANLKIKVIRSIHKLKLNRLMRRDFFSIFQKSK